jgi:hypothetical protein
MRVPVLCTKDDKDWISAVYSYARRPHEKYSSRNSLIFQKNPKADSSSTTDLKIAFRNKIFRLVISLWGFIHISNRIATFLGLLYTENSLYYRE